jgi:hypothetical protein
MQQEREVKVSVHARESGINIYKTDSNPITFAPPREKKSTIRKENTPIEVLALLLPCARYCAT